MKENGDKVPAEDKPAIEGAIADLKKAKDASDIAAIDTAVEKLNQAMSAAYQKMNAAGQQPGAQAGPDMNGGFQGGQQGGDNHAGAEDADFEEVK